MTQIGVPSRRVDPTRYLTRDGDSSSAYVTASVSSGHQVGSKIGAPKPSARAGAAPQSFESISTADTRMEAGPPALRGALDLLMPSSLGGLPSGGNASLLRGHSRALVRGHSGTLAQPSVCAQEGLVLGYDETLEAASVVAASGSSCRAARDVGPWLPDWGQVDRALPRWPPFHHHLGAKRIGQGAPPRLGETPVVSGGPSLDPGDSRQGLGTNRERAASGALSARPSPALTRPQGSFQNTGPGECAVA